MQKRRHSILADLSFQAMLILMFLAVLFLAYDHADLAFNGIVLCIATVMFIITYFTSIRAGLAVDLLFIFLLVAYTALRSVNAGITVPVYIYFWIFWPAGMIAAVSGYVSQNRLLDEENKELVRRSEKYTTIDELTQMNNLLAFERDAAVYMNLSRRYHLELELVLWRLTYQEDLERLLGKKAMAEAAGILSDSIRSSLRKEDLIYLVDKEPYIWGTLLFSKPEAARAVISHVQEGVREAGLKGLTARKSFSLEMTGTVIIYDGSSISPLAFLNKAKRQFWLKDYQIVPGMPGETADITQEEGSRKTDSRSMNGVGRHKRGKRRNKPVLVRHGHGRIAPGWLDGLGREGKGSAGAVRREKRAGTGGPIRTKDRGQKRGRKQER